MTTDLAVVERALVVMAVCFGIQTLLFVGGAFGAFLAWRKAIAAFEEARGTLDAQIAQLRIHVDRISSAVDEVAGSVSRGTSAVGDVVSDMREAMGSVRSSVGTVTSVVTAPRAALAIGLLRGLQMWRRRRRISRRMTSAAAPQI